MKPISICTIIGLSVLASSCYSDLDLDQYRPDPTIVLNSVVSPDTVVMAGLSKTVFFPESSHGYPSIQDAEVKLFVNDIDYGIMTWHPSENKEGEGMYTSAYRPQSGDKIRIEAHTRLGDAQAEDIVPSKTSIRNVEIAKRTIPDPNGSTINSMPAQLTIVTYSITFTDQPSEKNYYCIRIANAVGGTIEALVDFSEDAVFIAQRPILDSTTTDKAIYGQSGRTFTDELIDGKEYTMTITESQEETMYFFGGPTYYRSIYLYSLSESYYKYLTGILNDDETTVSGSLTDFGMAEPNAHFTNVRGGTGILGGVQCDTVKVNLRTIIPDYYD